MNQHPVYRILIAEDESGSSKSLSDRLEDAIPSCTIVTCGTLDEVRTAFDAAERSREPFHVIISDYRMKQNGCEVGDDNTAAEGERRFPRVFIIRTSSHGEDPYVQRMKEASEFESAASPGYVIATSRSSPVPVARSVVAPLGANTVFIPKSRSNATGDVIRPYPEEITEAVERHYHTWRVTAGLRRFQKGGVPYDGLARPAWGMDRLHDQDGVIAAAALSADAARHWWLLDGKLRDELKEVLGWRQFVGEDYLGPALLPAVPPESTSAEAAYETTKQGR